jgi:cholest-4-en-3-one 26-monooxygenase
MASTALDLTPDLLDPSFYQDLDGMHECFRALRSTPGLWRDERNELWAAVHHADVIEIERRDRVFSSDQCYRSTLSQFEEDMIALDDPAHAEQRRLVSRRFTPRAVAEREAHITMVVDDLIDSFIDDGELDVVAQLAAPLACRVAAQLIGFPDDRWPDIKTWSERLMRYDRTDREPEVFGQFYEAILEFSQVLGPILEQRQAEPADDLISIWSRAEVGGCPMEPTRVVQETGLMISGGAETTRTVVGRGLAALCAHPAQWDALADEPALVPGAVEELIRWVTPLNNFFRTAKEDASVGGTQVAAGDRMILLYPSANRDEAIFADPFTFDIRRDPNPHVAFGFGTHFCLGSSLARAELRVMLARLAARVTNLELRSPPELEANIFASAVRSCRIGFDRR